MGPQYDIFQAEADGSVLWRGATETLEDAKVRTRQLADRWPGHYLILNLRTGAKLMINCVSDGSEALGENQQPSLTRDWTLALDETM
jgi:hypothetical protein